MRTKRYINDPKELLAQGQMLVKENSDIKFAHRVSMVNLILSGMSAKELATHCGDGETTLMSWVTKVDQFGWDALHTKKQPGKTSKLTEEQVSEIKAAVMSDPNGTGCDFGKTAFSEHLESYDFSTVREVTPVWVRSGSGGGLGRFWSNWGSDLFGAVGSLYKRNPPFSQLLRCENGGFGGTSGDTELFKKCSNTNGFEGYRVAFSLL